MSNNSKEAMTKKQQDDLNSALSNLPWGLPLGFPSMPPFGAFPTFGLGTPNFPSLNSFASSGSTAFPLAPSLLSADPTNPSTSTDLWANGLSTANSSLDYNEYAKQLGFLMNAFTEQQQQPISDSDKSKNSSSVKHSKTKRSNTPSSTPSDMSNGKTPKLSDDTRRSLTTTPSSSSNKSSSRSRPSSNASPNVNTSSKSAGSIPPTQDPSMLDPLAFAAAAAAAAASGGLTFPYFLPSLLSQTPSSTSSSTGATGASTNSSTYPFPNLSNPTAGLYPFLSPDWFTSATSLPNLTPDPKASKKRSKSIRTLQEEQEKNAAAQNTSLLHSALTDVNGLRASRQSSTNETILNPSADESKSNDDDDSDPNPKRKKIDEVNETLVRIPLNLGWKRVTIVRAITRTGVRGDVFYYAPCGRKLRSFQEIDRYLAKKNITTLDRSHFTFSSKVHIGFFNEPKEGPDGKTIFQESTEDEIVNRILELNPKFRRIETASSPSMTPNKNGNGDHSISQNYDDNRKQHRSEQEEMAKRAAEIKNMRLMRNLPNENPKMSDPFPTTPYQHTDFLKAIIEQQKLVQQQELEHKQKLQQEQQEQERKRQELAYLKQLELKKRQEEKMLLLEQRKAEKNAQRERKIQEKYVEIVLARETKRVAEDMQLKDLKPLPTLKPIENMRLSTEAFANCLLIIEFLNNFKEILEIPEHLIPTLNSFQQTLGNPSSRDLNSLCQNLLRVALDDPGIPNPKKALTNLGQKLSEIDITEHTFSEILRIYIRERNGFEDRLTQSLSDSSFQALIADEKAEILAFLCNDLSSNKRVVELIDRNLEELTGLKHEKFELEKRLRRLKFEKFNSSNSNNMKKMASLIREKDVNSSDNESPDESDEESTKIEEDPATNTDPATASADDQDIETLDETKIDDPDKRLALVSRKYTLIKRRVIEKLCSTRALHLGQDRYRRRYWYYSHLPGIYIEGLSSGDIPADDILMSVENVTKQKLDRKPPTMTNECNTTSRTGQRKKQQQQSKPTTITPPASVAPPDTNNKVVSEQSDNEDEQQQQQIKASNNASEDLATMDLSAFCMAVQRDEEPITAEEKPTSNGIIKEAEMKIEPSIPPIAKRELDEAVDENLPLDLSCSKSKRTCTVEQRPSLPIPIKTEPTSTVIDTDQYHELNDLATAAMLINNMKHESGGLSKSLLDFTPTNLHSLLSTALIPPSMTQESSLANLKQIERSIREKFQYPEPIPIPEDVQTGWWCIQTPEELRALMKCLAKRGQRERYLCRMLQRYFDVITNSMKSCQQTTTMSKTETNSPSGMDHVDNETNPDDQQQTSFNDLNETDPMNFDDTQEMDVLNEIYNLSDRIIASSLQCRSYETNAARKRLTYADIQAKGSDVLDEAKQFLSELERNIERRYLKHPFVRKYEINLASLNRINQHGTYHHTMENSSNEMVSSSKYDEVPQQLERWRRTVQESRTPAQLALCLTQLERCVAWEKSIMRVYCEICNSDVDEEKLLLCDGCDHGTHTYCFIPPMSFIPPNDWYCYVCIGKAKGENLCFVCGNKGDNPLNRCEHCSKLFHEECLKNAKYQRGKWLCVLCAANDSSTIIASLTSANGNGKWPAGRQTSRSTNTSANATNNSPSVSKTRQPSVGSTTTNGESTNHNRSRSNNNRKSKSRQSLNLNDSSILQETHSNSSHADATTISSSIQSPLNAVDLDDDIPSPTVGGNTSNGKKKSSKKSKNHANENEDMKACRVMLNELLKNEASWPFQTPVDVKQHPEYYECIKNPMDFSTMKKKMRNHQYQKREEFFRDVELILDNCRYYNEDDSPVGEAGHALRTFFEERWAKQFG